MEILNDRIPFLWYENTKLRKDRILKFVVFYMCRMQAHTACFVVLISAFSNENADVYMGFIFA